MNFPRRCVLPLLLGAALMAQAPEKSREVRWKRDLEAFAARYSNEHPAPFRYLPKAEFTRRVEKLSRELPVLKDREIAARWARLVADLGDEHTEVDFDHEFGAKRLPVEIESYADGMFIVGAIPPFESLIGARLEGVEGVSMETLRQALKPYVPFRQEGWFNHLFAESFGSWPLLMDAAGIVKLKERWTLSGTGPDDRPFLMEVPIGRAPLPDAWVWEGDSIPVPLRDRDPRAICFFKAMEKEKALYFRLRSCDDSRRRPFRAVLARAMKAFRKSGLERFVVDLRGNTGGSEELVDRLISTLQKEPRLRKPGNLLALTDGAVFSAAAVAAWRLRHEAGALLVGEASGASANHIGAVEEIRLPSGRIASFGTQVHIINPSAPDDFKSAIPPDLEIRLTHEEVLKGRDPVLEAALGISEGR